MVNPRFRLGHFQVRQLLVITRGSSLYSTVRPILDAFHRLRNAPKLLGDQQLLGSVQHHMEYPSETGVYTPVNHY